MQSRGGIRSRVGRTHEVWLASRPGIGVAPLKSASTRRRQSVCASAVVYRPPDCTVSGTRKVGPKSSAAKDYPKLQECAVWADTSRALVADDKDATKVSGATVAMSWPS